MFPIRTIVHPTDFSENSRGAWEIACLLARDHGSRLLLVHVEPPQPRFAEPGAVPPAPVDRRALERLLAQIRPADPTLTVIRKLLVGDEASEIDKVAAENHADLIVMGTHGCTGLGRFIMGSVAEQVIRQAPCPVLTVRTLLEGPAQTRTVCEAAASS
jgi:nucleotide-binding universal stress UspA family protein